MSLLEHPEARAILADAVLTPEAVRGCVDRLAAFLERYLPRFRRVERRHNASLVVRGLLSGLQVGSNAVKASEQPSSHRRPPHPMSTASARAGDSDKIQDSGCRHE